MGTEDDLLIDDEEKPVEGYQDTNSSDANDGYEYLDSRVAGLQRPTTGRDLQAIFQIPVKVSAILGQSTLTISELLKLHRGTIIELDRKIGEAVDIYVNERLVARGEVVLVEEKLGITLTEVVKRETKQVNPV